MAVVFLLAFVAFLSYMLSGETRGTDQSIVARVTRFIPLHSVKIVIVVWQILTQVRRTADGLKPILLGVINKTGFGYFTQDFFYADDTLMLCVPIRKNYISVVASSIELGGYSRELKCNRSYWTFSPRASHKRSPVPHHNYSGLLICVTYR